MKGICMEKGILVLILIMTLFLVLTPAFIWVNNHFNDAPPQINETEHSISQNLLMKNQLLSELQSWMLKNRITEQQAMEKLGVNKIVVDNVIRHSAAKFSIGDLVTLVSRTGVQVSFSVKNIEF